MVYNLQLPLKSKISKCEIEILDHQIETILKRMV